MTNTFKNYTYTLQNKFAKSLPMNNYNRIVTAIMIIETDNRSLFWRIIEYIASLRDLSLYKTRKCLVNYSIGKYQLKISMILDYMKINYSTKGKRIYNIEKFDNLNKFELMKICKRKYRSTY